jgi:hypothetical protein
MLTALIATAGCDEKLRDLTGPTPNLNPSFSSIRTEIFEKTDLAGRSSCTTCHTDQGRNPAGQLNLRADPYGALVNVASRQKAGAILVVPGNPDASYLVHKLEGRSDIVQLRMPRNGPPYLTQGQMTVIRRWIENGAPNN